MIKQNKIKKNIMALLLAVATIVTTCPQGMNTVHAAEPLDCTKFATVDELKNFNTDDTDGTKNAAKVYFGNDDQQWWIVGSQKEQGLTLFAASPLAIKQVFEPNYSQNKTDPKLWADCSYTIGTAVTEVYPNHYGASHLRTKLKELETSYFSGKEQALMNETKIYTNDTKNSSVYSTTDKLYLAHGFYPPMDKDYIEVGTSNTESQYGSLHIDQVYWDDDVFWLRTPNDYYEKFALFANQSRTVNTDAVTKSYGLVPAFELNLSSVIFASTAQTPSSDGKLSVNDAFTLRYDAAAFDKNLGSAEVTCDNDKILLTDVPEHTYLVVQNSEGAWAKNVTNRTLISSEEIDRPLSSFENCKVWLEQRVADDGMVYATWAEENQGYDVKISTSEGLKIKSNNGVQAVAPNDAINDIIVEVADGYYLPDRYQDTIQGLNGLNVKDVTQTGFTISGTPTSDVNIQLPAATPKAEQTFPADIALSGTGASGVGICGTTIAMEYAPVIPTTTRDTYSLNLEWKDCQNQFTPTDPGTYLVRLKETETQKASDSVQVVVKASSSGSDGGGGGGSAAKLNPVYRAYNPNNGEHLYTLDEKEYKHVTSLGWHDEGVAFMAETEKNGQALYRVYNPNSGLHHYTSDENEKNMLVSLGWDEEGIAWYASNKPQSAPVYRVYNPNDGQHHYTMDGHEKDVLVSLGWTYEGIAFKTAPIE